MRSTALAFALAAVVALTGCVPQAAPATPGPEPTFDPVFASDEEALAAAEEAYGAYLRVVDLVFSEGGAHSEWLEDVAAGEYLSTLQADAGQMRDSGSRTVGVSHFRNVVVQHYDLESKDPGFLAVYLCDDISQVDMLNREGVSMVPPTVKTTSTMLVTFSVGSNGQLLVSNRELWNEEPC